MFLTGKRINRQNDLKGYFALLFLTLFFSLWQNCYVFLFFFFLLVKKDAVAGNQIDFYSLGKKQRF